MSILRFFRPINIGAVTAWLIGAALLSNPGSVRADTITYNKDIAPIVFKQCVSCHRPEEVAPFSLMTYQDFKKRAKQIALVTEKRTMPPWKLEPGYGEFKHERRLTETQIATIKEWAQSGAPEGNPADLPPRPKFTDGWQLGKPDLILKMPKAFAIHAEGNDVNRSFPLHVQLPADRYIRAAEFRPGNRRVVHHATLMMDKSGKAIQLEKEQGGTGAGYVSFGGPGFVPAGGLPGYAPGMPPEVFPLDAAGVLPKEVDIVFGMHYHPTGKVETDQSSIGLYFTDKPPTRIGSLITMGVLNLDIAPGEKAHLEQDSYTLPVAVEIEAIYEHLHLIGKTCKLWAELPDRTIRPIIKINDWDFNWQSTYHVKERIRLPKGTVLHAEWTHDNTAENIHNPNHPPKRVTYGENSTDEMAGALINVYVDSERDNGILWLTNLAHLGKASVTPAQRPSQEKKSPPINVIYDGVASSLIGLMEAPLPTLGMLLMVFVIAPFITLVSATHRFPRPTQQAADTLGRSPFRSFGLGLAVLAGLALFALPSLYSTNVTAQVWGALLWFGAAVSLLLGMGGLSRRVGRRLLRQQEEETSFSALAKSSFLLTFALLFPVLGWFIVAPLAMTAALGAGVATLWPKRQRKVKLLKDPARA
ncbi:hypothetical protein [Armatimonas sp.]|uniref:hypothetical protein n=1 Tax=Armatimonas sp. TaxID=1872638 RepID=UPI0037525369